MDAALTTLDTGGELAGLLKRFYPLVLELAYGDAGATLGLDLSFSLDNPRVQDAISQLADRVSGITETTRAQIQALIAEGTQAGWSADQLARALRDAGVTDSASRSESIARTETATAYTQGSLLAYGDSGVVDRVEWLTGGDACDLCAPLDGQRAALGAPFPGTDVSGPPLHPRCRCAVSPVLIGQE